MSLLSKPKLNKRWKRLLLVVVSLLLLVPSLAAAAFAMRFEVANTAQDPAQKEQEIVDKKKAEVKWRVVGSEEAKEALAQDPRIREEIKRKQEVEMEMRGVRQAALVTLARISMDQAIQIATSQTPGKVLLCSLDGSKWEEPGKLAKDGVVFYHVVVADETAPAAATHVWVNAVDGTIIKTEKELLRRRSPENK